MASDGSIPLGPVESSCFDVRARLAELGCELPSGIAFLPQNLEWAKDAAELKRSSEEATVRTLLRNAGLSSSPIRVGTARVPVVINRSVEWVAPVLFVSSAMMTNDPNAVSLALGVLSNYLTDLFRGVSGERAVRVEIIVERSKDKEFRKIEYVGDIEGMKGLDKVVEAAFNK